MLFSTVEDRIIAHSLPYGKQMALEKINFKGFFTILQVQTCQRRQIQRFPPWAREAARVFDSCSEAKTRNPLSQAENSVNFFEF